LAWTRRSHRANNPSNVRTACRGALLILIAVSPQHRVDAINSLHQLAHAGLWTKGGDVVQLSAAQPRALSGLVHDV